jgi:hypothetical protein
MENIELLLVLLSSCAGMVIRLLYDISVTLGDIKEILESRKEKS